MIIRLPENFIYTTSGKQDYAYVKNGMLYIEGFVNFENLMYNLAYSIYGYGVCYYCGEELTTKNRTLDHIYPRSWGGISLPDNLRPSCKACNQKKSDMTPSQFEKFLVLESQGKENTFYQKCLRKNQKIIQSGTFILPSDWVRMYDATKLTECLSFKYLEKSKMGKLAGYYNRVHQYHHPIVVSSNDWLFKGKHILYHARKIGNPIVPAIILDNVVVIMNTS